MPSTDATAEVTLLLEQWDRNYGSGTDLSTLIMRQTVSDTELSLVDVLTRLAEIVERETEAWYKMDPDPFDDRHPRRTDPKCALGHVLKTLFKNDNMMNKLVSSYLVSREQTAEFKALHSATARLLLDVMPGLETSVIFPENEPLVRNLVDWAQGGTEPLRSYAVGLLAAAMESQQLAATFKESNATLVPMMLKHLRELKERMEEQNRQKELESRPFRNLGHHNNSSRDLSLEDTSLSKVLSPVNAVRNIESSSVKRPNDTDSATDAIDGDVGITFLHGKRKVGDGSPDTSVGDGEQNDRHQSKKRMRTVSPVADNCNGDVVGASEDKNSFEDRGDGDNVDNAVGEGNESKDPVPANRLPSLDDQVELAVDDAAAASAAAPPVTLKRVDTANDCSNSRWMELEPLVIGTYRIHPMSVEMQQRLILHYLQPMGEYQELLSHIFDLHVLELLLYYIDLQKNKDVRLAFEALKYMAALLCHKRFAVEFIAAGGVQKLLKVHRPSVAATGVSMCLYHLAYFEDAMERVCMLPRDVLEELVTCVLWLLECSHESGRINAVMFCAVAFHFKIIVELFDAQDGLRKLYNMLSMLRILNVEQNDNEVLNEDELFTNRQLALHVCRALRRYVEAHLGIKVEALKMATLQNESGLSASSVTAYKAAKVPPEVVQANIELLRETPPTSRSNWKPMTNFLRLGGVELLIKMLSVLMEATYLQGKTRELLCRVETLKSGLDFLAIACVVPRVLLRLCETVHTINESPVPAISVVLTLAGGEAVAVEPEVQKAALNVIINCVCGPMNKTANSATPRPQMNGSSRRRTSMAVVEDPLTKAWETVRSNNGIMILLSLITSPKGPPTEADSIRALACKALVGLSRCDTVKQIIGKLTLFNNGQLQQLMWEPVVQDRHQEHVKFCRYAYQLIEQVSGKPQQSNVDPSLSRLRRDIVTQTRIVYSSEELLLLIVDHLFKEGMTQSALSLQRELTERFNSTMQSFISSPVTSRLPQRMLDKMPALTSSQQPNALPTNHAQPALLSTPSTGAVREQVDSPAAAFDHMLTSTPNNSRLQVRRNARAAAVHQRVAQVSGMVNQRFSNSVLQSPSQRRASVLRPEAKVSLHSIVQSYCQYQHAACRHPVVTCPPFSLLNPHRCPEPKNRNSAPHNFTSRLLNRPFCPRFGGPGGGIYDRKYIYSRFRPIRSYRNPEDGSYTCCAFTVDETSLMLGTYTGELKFVNVQTSEESGVYQCHMAPLTSVEPARDGQLVLTSCAFSQPGCALWKINSFDMMHAFEEDHAEFSKLVQDRIVGSKDWKARIYDVGTGQSLMTLYEPDRASNYLRNQATFNPSDDLVLNDGVLYDVGSGKSIHKFDKFNANISGVFHPNGLEIIINSQVWDIRTYHLLHTVSSFDQCNLKFNNSGNIIYGAIYHHNDDITSDDSQPRNSYSSSFRTFDGANYSNIATIDVKRSILDLCPDSSDCYLALVETQKSLDSLAEETLCRLYEVGRLKDDEDDQADEEDMQDEDDDDNDDDDDDESLPHSDQSFVDLNDDGASTSSNDDHEDAEFSGSSDHDISFGSDDENDDDFDDDEDDDMDNVLFELSDLSNL